MINKIREKQMKFWATILIFSFFTTAIVGQTRPSGSTIQKKTNSYFLSKELVAEVNAYRVKGCKCNGVYFPPVRALVWSAGLAKVAMVHSKDMMDHSFYAHKGSDGSQVYDRAMKLGVKFTYIGENIFLQTSSLKQPQVVQPQEIVEEWIISKTGHCENIMDSDYKKMGAARFSGIVKKEMIDLTTLVLSD